MLTLKVKLIHKGAAIPERMTSGSAGFDLCAAESIEIPPTQALPNGNAEVGRGLVPIGIEIELPSGTVGRIASRSGLSTSSNIEVGAGWIDSDYRGPLMVELKNLSSKPYRVKPGDRVAQLIILPMADIGIEVVPRLKKTVRGPQGFGSTDLNVPR